MQIKHKHTGAVLFDANCATIHECAEAAVRARAELRGADLREAYLREANLRVADLRGAYLSGADLSGAKLPDFWLCPEEGAFVGWKKLSGGSIAKLEIPAEAKRVCSPVGRKMRAEYVKTLAVFDRDGESVTFDVGARDGKTKYIVGEITRPDKFDDDIRVECTHGIHFFITRAEAEAY